MAPKREKQKQPPTGNGQQREVNEIVANEQKSRVSTLITEEDLQGYPDVQQNEFLATQAIYPDEFLRIRGRKEAWKTSENLSFQVRLNSLEDPDVFVKLELEFPKEYPKVPIKASIIVLEPENAKFRTQLEDIIKGVTRSHLGSECVHEITGAIDELINRTAISKAAKATPFSLEEERAKRAEAARLAEQKKLDDARNQQEQQAADKQYQLNSRLDTERRRREIQGAREVESDTDLGDEIMVEFDQYMHFTTKDGKEIKYKDVNYVRPIMLRKDKDVQIGRPRLPKKSGDRPLLLLKEIYLPTTLATKEALREAVRDAETVLEKSRHVHHKNVLDIINFRISEPNEEDKKYTITVLTPFSMKGSLHDYIDIAVYLQPLRVKEFLLQLLDGVIFLESQGIVHPAIHPGNIIISEKGREMIAQLSDAYGLPLREIVDKGRDPSESMNALPELWKPPELKKDSPYFTASTAMWHLGIVVLQMAVGLDVYKEYATPIKCLQGAGFTNEFSRLVHLFFEPNDYRRLSPFKLKGYQFFYEKPTIVYERDRARLMRQQRLDTGIPSKWNEEWERLGNLGEGGFGSVYRARSINDLAVYAIKIIEEAKESAIEIMRQEVVVLTQVKHWGIVRYYQAWIESDAPANKSSTISDSVEAKLTISSPNETFARGTSSVFEAANDQPEDWMSLRGPGPSPERESDHGGNEESQDSSSSDEPAAEYDDDDDYDNAFQNQRSVHIDPSNLQIDLKDLDNEQPPRPLPNRVVANKPAPSDNSTASGGARLAHTGKIVDFSHLPPLTEESSSSTNQSWKLYIQMELCEGETLRDLFGKKLAANANEITRILRILLESLVHVHKKGVVHRDLKPENIFIDQDYPKIGDFGLATTTTVTNRGGSQGGTIHYLAPEVISTGKSTAASDMYSLGIILFEMCYPLETRMERREVLSMLNRQDHELPPYFQEEDHQVQGVIIKQLIDHNPENRPTASGLLHNPILPEYISDAELFRHIQRMPADAYEAFIGRGWTGENEEWKEMAFTSSTANAQNQSDSAAFDAVCQQLQSLFQKHGAVSESRPTVIPKSSSYDNMYGFHSRKGLRVQLPVDLTMPMARSLASHPPEYQQMYTMGVVYRDGIDLSEPTRIPEVDFDIVSYKDTDSTMKEATVIFVLDEILGSYRALASKPWIIFLNHVDILDMILDHCRVAKRDCPKVKRVLHGIYSKGLLGAKKHWTDIRAKLRSEECNIPETSVGDLQNFLGAGNAAMIRTQLQKLFRSPFAREKVGTLISRLEETMAYLERLKVETQVVIAPLIANSEFLYRGSITFELLNRETGAILAAGGRYDNLIRQYSQNPTPSTPRAVGFRLNILHMVDIVAAGGSAVYKASKSAKHGTIVPFSRCEVVVTSFDAASLVSSGLECARVLWKAGIQAELSEEVSKMEEIEEAYKGSGPYWLVIVKGGLAEDSVVRVLSPAKRENEVVFGELAEWLATTLARWKARKGR